MLLFEVLEEWEDADGESEGRVCMVQEYMEGGPTMTFDDETELFKRPISGGGGGSRGAGGGAYPEAEAKPLFRDLVQGLLYLHGRGIVHRDIKVCCRKFEERNFESSSERLLKGAALFVWAKPTDMTTHE